MKQILFFEEKKNGDNVLKYFNAERIIFKYQGPDSFINDGLRKWNVYFYTLESSLCLQTAFLEVLFVGLDAFCHLGEMTKFQIAHGYI